MTQLMGILNITPDSFSDGGEHLAPAAAMEAITRMIEEGADIIDMGAESTRPGATPLTHEEEWARLGPVLLLAQEYCQKMGTEISIDTRRAKTAWEALSLGAHWINDVSGFSDPAMVECAKAHHLCKLVVMHSLSIPADKEKVLPENADAVEEVLAFGKKRIAELEKAGIGKERIAFDPGIGFGKTAPQSLALIRGIERFGELGVPLLVGHSRKSFLAGLASDRDEATLAVSEYLALKNVAYLRVHDVAAHRKMLSVVSRLA